MNTKNIIIAILVIIIVLLLWRNWSLMFPSGKPQNGNCPTGAFLVETAMSVSQFRQNVNSVTLRNLKTLNVGDCITGYRKVTNDAGVQRIVDAQGFDITDAGKIVA